MKLELTRQQNGSWRIITDTNSKNKALQEIAYLLGVNNQHSNVKIGIFNVYGGFLSSKVSVHSYIANKTIRMTKHQYRKWLLGSKPKKVKVIPQEESVL